MAYLIRCVSEGSGHPSMFDGLYLARYEPEAYDGRGLVEWSEDAAEAVRFATREEAFRAWTHVPVTRATREDGASNRPLTAYTVEVIVDGELEAPGQQESLD